MMRKKILSIVFKTALLVLFIVPVNNAQNTDMQGYVVGYYPEWMQYYYPVSKIKFDHLTHIMHAFVWPNADGTIHGANSILYPELNQTAHEKGVKVILSFGGAGKEPTAGFQAMIFDSTARSNFVKNVTDFLIENNYDGIDLDWEPEGSSQVNKERKAIFTTLVKSLRESFNERDSTLMITMACGSGDWTGKNNDYETLRNYIDFFSIMTYDYHGEWTNHAGHNAPLYKGDNDGWADQAVTYMINTRKVPKTQVTLGIPFYGKIFNATGLYKPQTGSVGAVTYSGVMKSYANNAKWVYYWDNNAKVPYYLNETDGKFLTFDDTLSVKIKTQYAIDKGLAGVMIWEITNDLVGERNPLLEMIGATMRGLTSVETPEPIMITEYKLFDNYPNPFNPTTTIRFSIPREENVKLIIYNTLGQEVSVLVNDYLSAGMHEAVFSAANLSSGVYFYSLTAGNYFITKKMLLVK